MGGGERQALCTSTPINWFLSTVFYSCAFQPWCILSSRKTSMNGGLSSPLRRRVPFALLSWVSLSTTSFCHTGEEGERRVCVKTCLMVRNNKQNKFTFKKRLRVFFHVCRGWYTLCEWSAVVHYTGMLIYNQPPLTPHPLG